MSRKRKRSMAPARAEPSPQKGIAFVSKDGWDTLECAGYVSLANNPEICTGVDTIARLVASMTIHLMQIHRLLGDGYPAHRGFSLGPGEGQLPAGIFDVLLADRNCPVLEIGRAHV